MLLELKSFTYYPVFQNSRNILQELYLLLAPDKEHKKVFPDVPVVGFRNGKSLKDYLVRATLPKPNETGRSEPCGKKTCLVCNSIRTTTIFTTEACGEIFKIQSGPLKCNSEKVLYLLKCILFKVLCYSMCVYIFGHFTFKILGQALLL